MKNPKAVGQANRKSCSEIIGAADADQAQEAMIDASYQEALLMELEQEKLNKLENTEFLNGALMEAWRGSWTQRRFGAYLDYKADSISAFERGDQPIPQRVQLIFKLNQDLLKIRKENAAIRRELRAKQPRHTLAKEEAIDRSMRC